MAKRRNQILWATTLIFAFIALIVLIYWFFIARYYESTNDAYVNGNQVQLTSRLQGYPIAYYADNTDYVKAGQLLVELDPTDYYLEYQKKKASFLIAVKNSKDKEEPLIEQAKLDLRIAYANLWHTRIFAPVSGIVAIRNVQLGQWTTPERSLLSIIPINEIWIDANFKETQLSQIRSGQDVTVTVDLYGPKHPFHGKVIGINPGTGSVFSLLPAQNATGNWIKIVQRVAVRIALDPEEIKQRPLFLGLSSTVEVDVRNTEGPLLRQTVEKQPVATTSSYWVDFGPLESWINKNK